MCTRDGAGVTGARAWRGGQGGGGRWLGWQEWCVERVAQVKGGSKRGRMRGCVRKHVWQRAQRSKKNP
jgi:hypothetical protein